MNCPACGAEIPARRGGLSYVTCAYCQSLLLRDGQKLDDIGKVATLPFDISPIQLGTSFTVKETQLVTVGRVRWGWAGGSWNEWLLVAEDGGVRWLAEAMGVFMLTERSERVLALPAARDFAKGRNIGIGRNAIIDGISFAATDVKHAHCLGSEGDLPFATLPGRDLVNVDFRAPDGSALSLQRDSDGTSAWLGAWYELSGLAPKGIRVLDGWAVPAGWQ